MELVAEGYLNQDEPEDRLGGEESAPAIEPVPLRRARKQISRKLTITPIELVGLERAKRGFSTHRVDWSQVCTLVDGPIRPRTGDLVLAQVDRLHYQRRIELPNGRKANLSPGDTIVVAYGDRYATDQFEAEVPLDLGRTNLVATGGVAAKMLSRNSGIRSATEITPLGLLADRQGTPINLRQFALPHRDAPDLRPPVFAVLGTSMNSGKTTTNQALATGLSRAGYKVGTAKVTGTGSGGDFWAMVDAGAAEVVDFTDAGYSATYKVPLPQLESIMVDLVAHLAARKCDVILVEVADGILQEQNVDFIVSPVFTGLVDGIFFAAGEAMGATFGLDRLAALGLPVLGLSGKLTASELLIREAERAVKVPIYRKDDLSDPGKVGAILGLDPPAADDLIEAEPDGLPASVFLFDRSGPAIEPIVPARNIA